jgi:NAD(P)-dependent dehydrogenase (short-subunit alcohol dehydrogenase family)
VLAVPAGFDAPRLLRYDDVTAHAITRNDLGADVRGINASLDLIRETHGGTWPTGAVTEEEGPLRGAPNASPYSASKHGVIGLTRTAAIEYAQRGIRVNAVCPGAIDTPMMDETFARFPGFREALTGFVPMGRMGAAAEVAAAIAWLLSDAASFITGEALTVEGGLLSR